jgi:hypothetical protein
MSCRTRRTGCASSSSSARSTRRATGVYARWPGACSTAIAGHRHTRPCTPGPRAWAPGHSDVSRARFPAPSPMAHCWQRRGAAGPRKCTPSSSDPSTSILAATGPRRAKSDSWRSCACSPSPSRSPTSKRIDHSAPGSSSRRRPASGFCGQLRSAPVCRARRLNTLLSATGYLVDPHPSQEVHDGQRVRDRHLATAPDPPPPR